MRRISFLVPEITITKRIVDELLLAQIEEQNIHVIAKHGTPLEDLPEAAILSLKSDFFTAMKQGAAIGGSVGTLAGLFAIALPATAPVIAGGVVQVCALAGANVSEWIIEMIGMSSTEDVGIKQYENAIETGQFLMLADVPKNRVDEIEVCIKQYLIQMEIKNIEPVILSNRLFCRG